MPTATQKYLMPAEKVSKDEHDEFRAAARPACGKVGRGSAGAQKGARGDGLALGSALSF